MAKTKTLDDGDNKQSQQFSIIANLVVGNIFVSATSIIVVNACRNSIMSRYNKYDTWEPIPYDPDFNGPLKHRSCTDIICLLLFLTFIGCWAGIAIYAFTSGDPNMLLVPKDSYGNRCGHDENVRDKPYLFFFDLTKCFGPFVPFTGCPTTQICVEECPKSYFRGDSSDADLSKLICGYNVDKTVANVNNGKCAKWYFPSNSFEKRCLPEFNETLFNSIKNEIDTDKIISGIQNLKALSQVEEVGQNIVDDLVTAWWKILIGIGIAVVVCIIYIMIMRWLAAPLVWLSLFGVLALLVAAVYFTAAKYIELRNNSPDADEASNVFESYATKKDTWLVLLIISSVVLLLVLLILIFLRKRILLAIALIKEGSKAVSSVTSVLFFPIFPWALQLAITAFGIATALYLATTGEPTYKIRGLTDECLSACTGFNYKNGDECVPKTFTTENNCLLNYPTVCENVTCKFIQMNNPKLYPYLQTFNVVGLLWGTFFASALGQMILASVFATWYWTWNKSNLPFFAVIEASLRTLRYHIGTLAFGSLIITICRIIRICLEYIDQKLKKYDNEVTKAVLCCCKCFFWCLEKFLKFINRNAYIMCAIHGKNFCSSAKDAFMLLMRNIVRVFVLDKVTDFLFFLGKLFITIGIGALSYMFFATDITGFDNTDLNYQIVPVIVIMIITYFIATMFFNVYSMAVDTLFLCFLEDCERNDGSGDKPYYMSKNLMKIFGKKNKLH